MYLWLPQVILIFNRIFGISAFKKSVCAIYHQQGHISSETSFHQNPPFVNWECQLTEIDLHNGRKLVSFVAVEFCTQKYGYGISLLNDRAIGVLKVIFVFVGVENDCRLVMWTESNGKTVRCHDEVDLLV